MGRGRDTLRSSILPAIVAAASLLGAAPSRAAIEGYCWPLSAAPGETLSFMVSSSTDFQVTYARYQRSGDSNASITLTPPQAVTGALQIVPPSAWEGCAWSPSFQLVVPEGWPSGIYGAECSAAGVSTFRISFVVRPKPGERGDFAILANTNTWCAYNDWGGRGKYTNPPAQYLSFMRPNPYARSTGSGQNHITRAELWVLDWLATSGYRCDVYTDLDFHRGIDGFNLYRGLILNTHPEYWTVEMLDALETYLAHGGSVLYIGGNGVYEEVRFSPDGRTVEYFPENWCGLRECRKDSYFRNLFPPRPERAVLGVAYRSDGFQTFAPFQVSQPAHRFFAGTGVTLGAPIGASGLNGGGASGWEMDTSIPGPAPDGVIVSAFGTDDRGSPPPNLELLARGSNAGGYGADMTYYEAAGGGGVFSAGSLSFGGSLVVDATLQKIVRNVLDEFLATPVSVADGAPARPAATLEIRPNPFGERTEFRWTRIGAEPVRLTVHDVSGRRLRTWTAAANAGPHGAAAWDGRDDDGRPVAAGVYLVRLEAGGVAASRRVLRIR